MTVNLTVAYKLSAYSHSHNSFAMFQFITVQLTIGLTGLFDLFCIFHDLQFHSVHYSRLSF